LGGALPRPAQGQGAYIYCGVTTDRPADEEVYSGQPNGAGGGGGAVPWVNPTARPVKVNPTNGPADGEGEVYSGQPNGAGGGGGAQGQRVGDCFVPMSVTFAPAGPRRPDVCMYECKVWSAAPAHARTRAHRPAAPLQNSGVSQTPHPTACPQAGIPHRPP